MGRFHFDPSSPTTTFDWPCTSLSFSFTSTTTLQLELQGSGNTFKVTLDTLPPYTLPTTSQWQNYTLSTSPLDPHHTHNITIQKMTEAAEIFAILPMRAEVSGFYLDDPGTIQGRPRAARRMEFFSDSDVNGFGILGVDDYGCLLEMFAYEDCSLGFPARLSEALEAEYHIEAWSGKGVVKNAEGLWPASSDPMPLYWNRTVATWEGSGWDFGSWLPDVIVIDLGSNDYYMEPYPAGEDFRAGYLGMLEMMVVSYPNQPVIVNLCGDYGTTGLWCEGVKMVVEEFGKKYPAIYFIEIPDHLLVYPDDYGCLDHRNVKGQEKVKEYLLPKFKSIMGW